jgi:murein DD-endopeptidase MepM/ murein hydrolase activator NlpD
MGTFPLPILPNVPWRHLKKSQDAYFGAPRSGGFPVHGACDLIVPTGTKVLAVQHGTIIRKYSFVTYTNKDAVTNAVTCQSTTWAIDVQHDDFVARYAEIDPVLPNGLDGRVLGAGSEVQEGQEIAKVGFQCGNSMLHFEMFKDRTRITEYLTNGSHSTKYANVPQANYERRDDLIDPTPYLDMWSWDLRQKLHRVMDLSFEIDD